MDLQKRTVIEPKFPMPAILNGLAARMRGLKPLVDFEPTEANANDYYPKQGMYLGPHVDDRSDSSRLVIQSSLDHWQPREPQNIFVQSRKSCLGAKRSQQPDTFLPRSEASLVK